MSTYHLYNAPCSIVENKKLNDTDNFDLDMRNVLNSEGQKDVLENPIPKLTNTSSDEAKAGKGLKKGKKRGTVSNSDIFVIEIVSTMSHPWVLDSGCCAYIITNIKGLRNRQRL